MDKLSIARMLMTCDFVSVNCGAQNSKLNEGVAFGRAIRSYACRHYARWPVPAAIPNAGFRGLYKLFCLMYSMLRKH